MIGSMFNSYCEEFAALNQNILSRIGQLKSGDFEADPSARRNVLRQLENEIQQASSLLNQMNIEARTASNSEYKTTVASSKEGFRKLKHQFEQVKASIEKSELLSRGNDQATEYAVGSREEMNRFEAATGKLEQQTDTLLESKRVLAETEEIALDVTSNLASNRESILSSHERIRETGGFIGQGQRLLRRMQLRESRRKLVLTGVMVFLFLVFILIIYLSTRE
mmetsp:Transcript_16642/g.18848  ORF Transcript_16642/g.18848 Transcript_16642/m.18848 type:complete len:223 (+) Transcript_16642:299-967(+)